MWSKWNTFVDSGVSYCCYSPYIYVFLFLLESCMVDSSLQYDNSVMANFYVDLVTKETVIGLCFILIRWHIYLRLGGHSSGFLIYRESYVK